MGTPSCPSPQEPEPTHLSPTPGAFLGGYSRGSAVSTYAAGSDSVVTTGSCPGPLSGSPLSWRHSTLLGWELPRATLRLSAFLAPHLGRVAEVRPTGDGRSFLIDQLRRIQQPSFGTRSQSAREHTLTQHTGVTQPKVCSLVHRSTHRAPGAGSWSRARTARRRASRRVP